MDYLSPNHQYPIEPFVKPEPTCKPIDPNQAPESPH